MDSRGVFNQHFAPRICFFGEGRDKAALENIRNLIHDGYIVPDGEHLWSLNVTSRAGCARLLCLMELFSNNVNKRFRLNQVSREVLNRDLLTQGSLPADYKSSLDFTHIGVLETDGSVTMAFSRYGAFSGFALSITAKNIADLETHRRRWGGKVNEKTAVWQLRKRQEVLAFVHYYAEHARRQNSPKMKRLLMIPEMYALHDLKAQYGGPHYLR